MNKLTLDILSKNHAILPIETSAPSTIPSFKDLLIKIFLNLNGEDTLSCALTCKRFYCIARSDPIINRFFYARFFPGRESPLNPLQTNGAGRDLCKLFQLKNNLKESSYQEQPIDFNIVSKVFVDHFLLLQLTNKLYTVLDLNTRQSRSLSDEPCDFLGSYGSNAFFYFGREKKRKVFNLEEQTHYDLPDGHGFQKKSVDSPYFYTTKMQDKAFVVNFWDSKKTELISGFSVILKDNLPRVHGLHQKYFYLCLQTRYPTLFDENYYVTALNIETGDYFDITDKGNFPFAYWPNHIYNLAPYVQFYKDYLLTQYHTEIRRWNMKEKLSLNPIDIGQTIVKWGVGDGCLFAATEIQAKIIDIDTGKCLHYIQCNPSSYDLSLTNGYFVEKNKDRIYFLNIKTGKKNHFTPFKYIIQEKVQIMHSLCIIPETSTDQRLTILDIDNNSILYNIISDRKYFVEAYCHGDNLFITDNINKIILRFFNSELK